MKFVVRNPKVGDRFRGRVTEVLEGGELVISFDGDLLRAQNESRRVLRVGDEVTVTVRAVAPLTLRLVPDVSFGRFEKEA